MNLIFASQKPLICTIGLAFVLSACSTGPNTQAVDVVTDNVSVPVDVVVEDTPMRPPLSAFEGDWVYSETSRTEGLRIMADLVRNTRSATDSSTGCTQETIITGNFSYTATTISFQWVSAYRAIFGCTDSSMNMGQTDLTSTEVSALNYSATYMLNSQMFTVTRSNCTVDCTIVYMR